MTGRTVRALITAFVVAATVAFGSAAPAQATRRHRTVPPAVATLAPPADPDPTVLVVGDSVALQIRAALEHLLGAERVGFVLDVGARHTRSPEDLAGVRTLVDQLDPDVVVVLFGTWELRGLPDTALEPEVLATILGDTGYLDQLRRWRALLQEGDREVRWILMPTVDHPTIEGGLELVRLATRMAVGDDPVLDATAALTQRLGGVDGSLTLASGRRVPSRSSDGLHLCPAGAVALADAALGRDGVEASAVTALDGHEHLPTEDCPAQ